ncbi:hypothetical protein CLOP_g10967 [Closterium sp. NIES-67]|nr:hypothetical protein CLOP_g10967 [Closterium sp. NIES-67]
MTGSSPAPSAGSVTGTTGAHVSTTATGLSASGPLPPAYANIGMQQQNPPSVNTPGAPSTAPAAQQQQSQTSAHQQASVQPPVSTQSISSAFSGMSLDGSSYMCGATTPSTGSFAFSPFVQQPQSQQFQHPFYIFGRSPAQQQQQQYQQPQPVQQQQQ